MSVDKIVVQSSYLLNSSNWLFKKFQNLAKFWGCTESGYQIWRGYLNRFNSYRLLNNQSINQSINIIYCVDHKKSSYIFSSNK